MKRPIFLIIILMFTFQLRAQSFQMNINFKNGSTVTMSVEDVIQIYFEDIGADIFRKPEFAHIINSLKLFQNYPNPFNSSTTIKYVLQEPGDVNIDIFNISGEKVWSVLFSNQVSGGHLINWDGKDKNGNKVSSGMYLYSIKVNNLIKSRKMAFIK